MLRGQTTLALLLLWGGDGLAHAGAYISPGPGAFEDAGAAEEDWAYDDLFGAFEDAGAAEEDWAYDALFDESVWSDGELLGGYEGVAHDGASERSLGENELLDDGALYEWLPGELPGEYGEEVLASDRRRRRRGRRGRDGGNPPSDGSNPPSDGSDPPSDGSDPPRDGSDPGPDGSDPAQPYIDAGISVLVGDGENESVLVSEGQARQTINPDGTITISVRVPLLIDSLTGEVVYAGRTALAPDEFQSDRYIVTYVTSRQTGTFEEGLGDVELDTGGPATETLLRPTEGEATFSTEPLSDDLQEMLRAQLEGAEDRLNNHDTEAADDTERRADEPPGDDGLAYVDSEPSYEFDEYLTWDTETSI